MYFVFYFIAGVVLLGIILFKFLSIIFDSEGYKSPVQKLYAVLLFLVMVITFINILIAVYSYRKTINMAGIPGERGLKGKRGKKGKKGSCSEQCGQKVCFVNLKDKANEVFLREVTRLLKEDNTLMTKLNPDDFIVRNKFFLEKINSICKSEQYQSIMLGKHPNKPNEKKLIEYLEGIIEEWIVYLLDKKYTGCFVNENVVNDAKEIVGFKCGKRSDGVTKNIIEDEHKGVRFLIEPNYGRELLNFDIDNIRRNPFQEFEKYDIWDWGEGLKIKPIQIKVKTKNLEKPEPDQATLQIKKSNNYKWVFDTSTNKDLWDDTNCEYGQMGEDKTNPQNLSKCVFINKNNYLKDYVNTWKTDVYRKDQEISFFNPVGYKDGQNNQQFYPVGSVWRGNEDKKKPNTSERFPSSKNSCGTGHGVNGNLSVSDEGPEKSTILVSGDVKKPQKMDLIWDNKEGCENCQINTVRVYRPVAPDGYVCLGDYVKGNTEPINDEDLESIRCVPKKCVREHSVGSKVYDNKNVSYDKYNNYSNYSSKQPETSDIQLAASVWTAGVDDVGVAEEQNNLYGLEIESNDGYNLFRMGRGYRKPTVKSYTIKEECLMPGQSKNPEHPFFDAKKYLDENPANDRYNLKEYFGLKPPFAILTNNDTYDSNVNRNILNFEYKKLRLYLEDDLTTRKDGNSDTYFIKTYNPEKNNFSNYIVTNRNEDVVLTDRPNKTNPYHRWVIKLSDSIVTNQAATRSDYNEDDIPEGKTLQSLDNIRCQHLGSNDYTYNVFIESYGLKKDGNSNRGLRQFYDNMGVSKFVVEPVTTTNWIYNTFASLEPPKYCFND